MSFAVIPDEWKSGIKAIDDEFIYLLDLVQTQHHKPSLTKLTMDECFDDFYERLQSVFTLTEKHMKTNKSLLLKRYETLHDKTLSLLIKMHKEKSGTLLEACHNTLLTAISNADLYYKNPY